MLVANVVRQGGEARGEFGETLHARRRVLVRLARTVVAGMWFGLCMTAYVLFVPGHPYRMQVIASLVKVPALLLLTPTVAFIPTSAVARLIGAGVCWRTLARWAAGSIAATALTLVPLGVIVGLSCVTKNYSTVVLCSYAAFALAGAVGVWSFARAAKSVAGACRRRVLIVAWAIAFGLVGARIGWAIRPLVGWTGQTFTWFRSEPTGMFEQIYWEVWNLSHFGGARFPSG